MNILLFSHFCHVSRTLVGGRWPGRWSVVCGRSSISSVVGGEYLVWSVVNIWFGHWLVVFMVGASGGRWSVSNVVGGRCFAFLLVGGRFLFLRMVGGRCLNQYMVGGRWSVVGGRWSVAHGRWSVVCGRWLVGGRLFCTTPFTVALRGQPTSFYIWKFNFNIL